MKKLNLASISAGLNTVQALAQQNAGISHSELIDASLIDLAEKNSYAAYDNDDSIRDLADRIEEVGLLQPLGVIAHGDRYTLFDGEHRFKAITTHLHWKKIPCNVFDGISENRAQLMLHIANGHREYTPSQKLALYEEFTELLQQMKDAGEFHGGIQRGVANLLQVSDRQARTYRMMSEHLTPEEKQEVQDNILPFSAAQQRAGERRDMATAPEKSATKQSESTSAFSEPSKTNASSPKEERFSEEDREILLFRYIPLMYDVKRLFRYYRTKWPTPAEAIKAVLKPRYGLHAGGGSDYDFEQRSNKTYVSSKGNSKYDVTFTYSEIDAAIRQMFRDGILLPKNSKEDDE